MTNRLEVPVAYLTPSLPAASPLVVAPFRRKELEFHQERWQSALDELGLGDELENEAHLPDREGNDDTCTCWKYGYSSVSTIQVSL